MAHQSGSQYLLLLIVVLIGAAIYLAVWAIRSRKVDIRKLPGANYLKGLRKGKEHLEHTFHYHATGIVSHDVQPCPEPEVCVDDENHQAHNVVNRTKKLVANMDEPVLVINDRTRFPDDPCNPLTDDEKKQLASTDEVATSAQTKALATVSINNRENVNAMLFRIIASGAFIVLGLAVLVSTCKKGG